MSFFPSDEILDFKLDAFGQRYNQCRKALRIESISVYRDPKTGQPYATKEAFKIIRERFMDENNNIKKMAMGDLFDSLVGTGFHGKRKRLPISNRSSMSHLPRFANFGRTPVVDIESSE
ncbi:hypothetical protein OIU84_024287 [Salix udensis]|uniref:Vps72/YL1 C-terminal domain-containing protein n=1 Tax=Salix udensis TaxID=889485 RepID=A0AAD6KH15_9ROSI|nr:hypothetical protein OIU84_024287 [Salix udensis]